MNWKLKYMTTPWVDQGRETGKGLDCWGLVVAVYKERLGKDLNPYPTMSLAQRPQEAARVLTEQANEADTGVNEWTPVDTPKDYDLVLMSKGKYFLHVGIYLEQDGGVIMHSYQGGNTVIQPLADCNESWAKLKFYRHD